MFFFTFQSSTHANNKGTSPLFSINLATITHTFVQKSRYLIPLFTFFLIIILKHTLAERTDYTQCSRVKATTTGLILLALQVFVMLGP